MAEELPRLLIAPDWIPLVDAAKWLHRRFQIMPRDALLLEMVTAIRRGEFRHRVAIAPRRVGPPFPAGIVAPSPGSISPGAIVASWDKAGIDWATGTVAGWPASDGRPARCVVELEWLGLERWALPALMLQRASEERERKRSAQLKIAPEAAPPKADRVMRLTVWVKRELKRAPRRWVALEELADWVACRRSAAPDQAEKKAFYRAALEALELRRWDKAGWTRAVVVNPERGVVIGYRRAREARRQFADGQQPLSADGYLRFVWVRRDLVARWWAAAYPEFYPDHLLGGGRFSGLAGADMPPSLFIDEAVTRIMGRLGCPETTGVETLLRALRAGDLSARRAPGLLGIGAILPPGSWAAARIDLLAFRAAGHSGLEIDGETFHLHYARLDRAGFDWWLGELRNGRASSPAPADELVAWMLDYATRNPLPKRDVAESDLRKAKGCTTRQARVAWNALPAHLKRAPRQTNRELTVQRAPAAR